MFCDLCRIIEEQKTELKKPHFISLIVKSVLLLFFFSFRTNSLVYILKYRVFILKTHILSVCVFLVGILLKKKVLNYSIKMFRWKTWNNNQNPTLPTCAFSCALTHI